MGIEKAEGTLTLVAGGHSVAHLVVLYALEAANTFMLGYADKCGFSISASVQGFPRARDPNIRRTLLRRPASLSNVERPWLWMHAGCLPR